MSWFQEQHVSFPQIEYDILHKLNFEQPDSSKDLAYVLYMPFNKITAWLSILKRRDLVRRDGTQHWKIKHVLTSLGRQRLAFLRVNVTSSKKQIEKSERATSTSTRTANDLPAKGYPKTASKGRRSHTARAAGGRRKQMSHGCQVDVRNQA